MFKPQDIEDLIEHSAQKQGVHSMTTVPTPGGVPVADENGFIDDGWLSSQIIKKGTGGKISVEDLPDGLALTETGSIPPRILPDPLKTDVFQSNGTTSATKFLLADGTDLVTLIANKVGAGGIKAIEDKWMADNNCSFRGYPSANCTNQGYPQIIRHVRLELKASSLFNGSILNVDRSWMKNPNEPEYNCYSNS
jgi:hypothetical protein